MRQGGCAAGVIASHATLCEKLTPTICYRYYVFTAIQPKKDPDLIKFENFMKKEAKLCSSYAQLEQAGHYSQPAQQNI